MSIAIIINPIAGGAAADRVELARRVVAGCGEPADLFVTTQPGHARQLATAARSAGARLVVVWGGDGTINEAASALAFGEVPLGVVPAGSGNGFARELGVPIDPADALRRAVQAVPRAIDVGEIAGRLFVNVAGIGFDAHVAERFNAPDNRRRGLAGYTSLTLRALARYRSHEYRVTAPGLSLDVRAFLIVLANGTEFGNRIRIAPRARLDNGALDLVVVQERSRISTVWQMRAVLTGAVERAAAWSSRPVREATIECDTPMIFHVDGEPVSGGTRLEARVHPSALRVCA